MSQTRLAEEGVGQELEIAVGLSEEAFDKIVMAQTAVFTLMIQH